MPSPPPTLKTHLGASWEDSGPARSARGNSRPSGLRQSLVARHVEPDEAEKPVELISIFEFRLPKLP